MANRMSVWDVVGNKIKRAEQEENIRAANVEVSRGYDFSVAPPCPPDKRLYIRGGYVTESRGFDGVVLQSDTPFMTCDFENEEETGMPLLFDNSFHYLPIILCYYGDWIAFRTFGETYETPVFDNVIGEEVATPAEAEAQIDAWMNGYTDWSYYRFPLRAVVLRNNGATGTRYAILPIDTVNRGRSYLYRDARTWTSLGSS